MTDISKVDVRTVYLKMVPDKKNLDLIMKLKKDTKIYVIDSKIPDSMIETLKERFEFVRDSRKSRL